MAAGPSTAPAAGPDLSGIRGTASFASYRALMANRSYRFWFFAALTTSLGDWAGLFALQIVVTGVADSARVELFSLGGIMMARLVPSLVIGPVAGVLADRYPRRALMVIADVVRGGLFVVMAFSGDLVAIFALTVIIETLALLFLSAKDAMLPTLVGPDELTQANQLNFLVTYGAMPFGAALALAMTGLVALARQTGIELDPAQTVLVLNAFTFFVSALLVRAIDMPERQALAERADDQEQGTVAGLFTEVREGLRAIADQPLVYALVTGVTGVFFGAGIIVAIGEPFVRRVLQRPDHDWFTMLTCVGGGLVVGIVLVSFLTNRFRIERVYPVALVLTALTATVIALQTDWLTTLVLGAALGAAAGLSVVTGYTLLHGYTADESRGRTFAAFYTATRVATFAALGLAPFLAGSIDVITVVVSGTGEANAEVALTGVRITMLLGGVVALFFAQRSARAMWRVSATPAVTQQPVRRTTGCLIAFEGVEGAGKSTQVEYLADYLREQGHEVITSREPGGTPVAEAVRAVLLDSRLEPMDDHAEALLYAAARADHVAKVIRPALERGAFVICDRYLDSSLAYQGHARGLGVDEIERINAWGTGRISPDLVVLLHLDVEQGLGRTRRRSKGQAVADRVEAEPADFHRQVAQGFGVLAQRSPGRYVVVDADGDVDTVAERVREAVTRWLASS
ncbi:MAG TPA: dTMP kinase [Euzebyales bacterium]|nr:dTMP kinase [Euzebyales bacterium]